MELEWKTCTVGIPAQTAESVTEASFDLDLQLPDYMADIHRVLHCSVTPEIRSVSVSGDRATVEGSGLVRLLYCSEDGQTHVYEQTFPIRRASADSLPTGNVHVRAATEYVNCRASGQRRAAVNGSVSLHFTAAGLCEQTIPTEAATDDLQTKTRQISVCSMTACTEKLFAMSEVVELKEEAPIGGILQSRTYVRVGSTKSVQDKVLVKGEAVTEIQYLSAADGNSIKAFRHTMPINQVIEAVGVSDNDIIDVTLDVTSSLIVPKADGSGENRLLDIALQIGAAVRCFAVETVQIICDAYSTSAELQAKYSETDMITDCFRWQESVVVREKTDLSGTDLQSFSLVCTDSVRAVCTVQDGSITAECTVNVSLLGQNSDGQSVWTEKPISFSCRKQLHEGDITVNCAPTVCLTHCSAALSTDGTLEVQADGFIDGMVYTSEPVRMLVSADASPIAETQSPAALTIYFADEGEPVWDIARRYRTTVDAVMHENALTGETVTEKQMLVIPLAG